MGIDFKSAANRSALLTRLSALLLFLDTTGDIAGAGLDSSEVRPTDSHLLVLTGPI
ncbi:MAG: hypothetical protein AAGC93_14100 [Cyanobacteria bacterium P01_F01_bin.53]